MQYPIPKYPDSLLLEKLRKVGDASTSNDWRVTFNGEQGQVFVQTARSGTQDPWSTNAVAALVASSSGYSGNHISLWADGSELCSISRSAAQPFDLINVQQGQFGNDHARYIKISGFVGGEFGNAGFNRPLPTDLSTELGFFVEKRDQGLARLEELYGRFTNQILQDRTRLENELHSKYDSKEKILSSDFEAKRASLAEKENALDEKVKSFETKEARYVARQEQQKQITQIGKWLDGWSVTSGTSAKRTAIHFIYIVALLVTAALAGIYGYQSYSLLSGAKDIASVPWWEWTLLSLKSIIPLIAFTTFCVYYIRWMSVWARLHAEEDFRNRNLLVDIGRAGWLLEAVRDAQDNNKQLPTELLHELSRNLFSHTPASDSGASHPQTIAEMFPQLTSIQVKAPDGTGFKLGGKK
ncbi:hypothetical protein [Opitutus sp. GAS368]|uniref:hypothetical protein n=1 Tax=Opitutus sp. GAS368 TaxID=1882749 RepID=UPI00087C9EED|nr:hypothetical protein [Opitutus sp. GAS368]SDS37980.1 hypothetical protein SAMN05444173_2725 [Opitutus sp. GAS368]